MATPDLDKLPGLPIDDDGPVFKAPWEAQAFALAVRLQEQDVFSWEDWAKTLGQSIAAAHAEGDPDLGNTYYHHWLDALERITTEKGLLTAALLAERKETVRQEHQRLHAHDH